MKATDVEGYIVAAPAAMQPALRDLRRIVLTSASGAVEKISYGMPTYEVNGRRLLHFAAAKKHIGVYGLVHVDADVPEALARYLDHRSTLRIPVEEPLPEDALASAIMRKADRLRTGP